MKMQGVRVLPNGNAMGIALDMDTNGNKVAKLTFSTGRGFNIQTNANLPRTHRMTSDSYDFTIAADEIAEHIKRFGTLRQRDVTGLSLFPAF